MSVPWFLFSLSLFFPVGAFSVTCQAYAKQTISRRYAVVLGLVMIASSVLALVGLTVVAQPFAEFLARPEASDGVRLLPSELKKMSSAIQVALWVLPFVSASIGTNLISDALTRGVQYGRRRTWGEKLQEREIYFSVEKSKIKTAERAQKQIFQHPGAVARLNAGSCAKRAMRRGVRRKMRSFGLRNGPTL
ncbi:hypothetical protein [Achromobacter animicus]|uniref:hypothetical protein n=1 Tax=Achromobacter animicus TaxID=1389935 RepID=UPI0015843ED8|nr:hypothetical protein [Achromobacter animicus]